MYSSLCPPDAKAPPWLKILWKPHFEFISHPPSVRNHPHLPSVPSLFKHISTLLSPLKAKKAGLPWRQPRRQRQKCAIWGVPQPFSQLVKTLSFTTSPPELCNHYHSVALTTTNAQCSHWIQWEAELTIGIIKQLSVKKKTLIALFVVLFFFLLIWIPNLPFQSCWCPDVSQLVFIH